MRSTLNEGFLQFDQLLLLSRGDVVYRGAAPAILPHFAEQGFEAPAEANPLDFVIDVSSVDPRTAEAELESKERVGRLVRAWREKEAADLKKRPAVTAPKRTSSDLEKAAPMEPTEKTTAEEEVDLDRAGLLRQTALITRRGLRNVFRDYGKILGLALQAIMCAVGAFAVSWSSEQVLIPDEPAASVS